MAERTETKRELTINMDRQRLHSAIAGAMRRKRIPRSFRGYDILRGVVFGLIDHPEYGFYDSMAKAVEVCSLPGSPETSEEGVFEAFDCIEPVLREGDFINPENGNRMSEEEIVKKAVDGLVYDIRKEWCYSKTIEFLGGSHYKDSLASELLKNMIFKKLIADDSTEECMYEYAYRKAVVSKEDTVTANDMKAYVKEQMHDILPDGKDPFEFACECVDEIYMTEDK